MFSYLSCQRGATAIEYVLMAAGIGLLIIGAAFAFGGELSALFAGLSDVTSGGE